MFDYQFAFLYGKVRTLKGKNLLSGGASPCLYRVDGLPKLILTELHALKAYKKVR